MRFGNVTEVKRQDAGRSSLLAAMKPSKGDGARTDTF